MRYGKERYSVTAGTFVFTSAGAIIVVWGILSCYVDEIIFCFKKKLTQQGIFWSVKEHAYFAVARNYFFYPVV